MIDTVLNILTPETVILMVVVLIPLLLLAAKRPEVVLALNMPAWLFLGQLKEHVPISSSAISAVFPIVAIAGGMLKGYKFRFGRIETALILLAAWMFFSLSYSREQIYGTEKVTLVLGQSLPLVLAASYTLVSFEAFKRALNVINLSLVVYVVFSFVVRLFAGNVENRFGAFHSVTVAGQIAACTAVVSLYWWWPRKKDWKIAIAFVFLASIYLSLISGTRTVLLGILFTIPTVQYLRETDFAKLLVNSGARFCALAWFGFIFLLVGQPLLSRLMPNNVFEQRFSSLEAFFWIGDFDEPSERVLNYTLACQGFAESPIRGLGAGGYKDAHIAYEGMSRFDVKDERHANYPHNIFLEFLCEQGIIGFLLFGFIVYHAVKALFLVRTRMASLEKPEQQVAIAVSALFIYGFIIAQTALDLPRQHFFWWGLGMLTGLSYVLKSHACATVKATEQSWHKPTTTHRPVF